VSCDCSNACGVIRPVGDNELVISACTWSEHSTFAAPLRTVVLFSNGFCALAVKSGRNALTGWNVLTWLPAGVVR